MFLKSQARSSVISCAQSVGALLNCITPFSMTKCVLAMVQKLTQMDFLALDHRRPPSFQTLRQTCWRNSEPVQDSLSDEPWLLDVDNLIIWHVSTAPDWHVWASSMYKNAKSLLLLNSFPDFAKSRYIAGTWYRAGGHRAGGQLCMNPKQGILDTNAGKRFNIGVLNN